MQAIHPFKLDRKDEYLFKGFPNVEPRIFKTQMIFREATKAYSV